MAKKKEHPVEEPIPSNEEVPTVETTPVVEPEAPVVEVEAQPKQSDKTTTYIQ